MEIGLRGNAAVILASELVGTHLAPQVDDNAAASGLTRMRKPNIFP
jgi:hypothetical protein